MMKRFIILLTCVMFCFGAAAQKRGTQLVIRTLAVELTDIENVLSQMDVSMFSFDLSDVAREPHKMWIYVDDHRDSTVKRVITIPVNRNMRYVEDYPKESWVEVRKEKKLRKNERIVSRIKELKIYLMPKNDSTTKIVVDLPTYGTMRRELKLHQVVTPQYSTYFYSHRPFNLSGIKQGQDTPLVLYGSGWWDPEANLVRMCGESKIEPDESSEIVAKLPQYYVIGIKVEKTDQ